MEIPLEICCSQVKKMLESATPFLLVDCRNQHEHDFVAIDGSVLIPMSELQHRHTEIEQDPSIALVVYCHHGQRSAQVAAWLRSQGHENAQSMAGGIDNWAQEIDQNMLRY